MFEVTSCTVHWLHILVQDIPTVAKLQSDSDLITDLDDLTLCEMLAAWVRQTLDRSTEKHLRCSSQHLHLSIQIFTSIVIHEEG